jgi:hypothetical protein
MKERLLVFGLITTITETVGALLIAVGVGICFGVGAALITGGALILLGSYLATISSERGVE